jgi:hypothetical protein
MKKTFRTTIYRKFFPDSFQKTQVLAAEAQELVLSFRAQLDLAGSDNFELCCRLHRLIDRAQSTSDDMESIAERKFTLLNLVEGLFIRSNFSKKMKTRPPGYMLLKVVAFLASKKFYSTVALQTISDMREEYFEALSQNRIWKARWVRLRGTYSFFAAIGLDRVFAFVSFFIKAWKSVN